MVSGAQRHRRLRDAAEHASFLQGVHLALAILCHAALLTTCIPLRAEEGTVRDFLLAVHPSVLSCRPTRTTVVTSQTTGQRSIC